jgi:hypothetical protein
VAQARSTAEAESKELSTPQLIDAALAAGEIDQYTAHLYLAYAFADYEKLPLRYRSNVPWRGTMHLIRLQEAVERMPHGARRARLEALLTGPCGTDSTGSLPNTYNSTHFHIEYDTVGAGLTINDYVTSLETAWTTQIDTFGWAQPPVLTSNPPPGNRYHVRIDSLGSDYGYVSPSGDHAGDVGDNPNTSWTETDAQATCMVLNEDYSGFSVGAQQALDATTAHEFNHSIQRGYGTNSGGNLQDKAFIEGGATWMEDEVYDTANDNYQYLWPQFDMCMGEYTAFPYRYWITFRGLTERYGTGVAGGGEQVMQDFWELTSQGTGMLSALNTALVNKGTDLRHAYHAYAIAVRFLKTCEASYVYPHCFEEATDYVIAAGSTSSHGQISVVNNSFSGTIPDNYALNWVDLPTTGGPYNVVLQNTASGGQFNASVVCDTGTNLVVMPLPATVEANLSSTLTDFDPSSCFSAVAVITNQFKSADNPTFCTARSYRIRATTIVYVDHSATGYEDGTPEDPFGLVGAGVLRVSTGGTVRIAAGSYDETLTINRAMTLESTGGTVTIGE